MIHKLTIVHEEIKVIVPVRIKWKVPERVSVRIGGPRTGIRSREQRSLLQDEFPKEQVISQFSFIRHNEGYVTQRPISHSQ